MNKKIKTFIIFSLVVFVIIFAVQNARFVEIQFLFWGVSIPRSLLIFVMLFIGFVIGLFTNTVTAQPDRNKEH